MRLLSRSFGLLEAAVVLTATRIAVGASPRRATAALLRRASRAGEGGPTPITTTALRVARDVRLVAPLVVGSTCLSRALAGWLMLRRRGVPSVVRVGAQSEVDSGMRMHAWLEVKGNPLIGQEEAANFVALNR